MTGSGAPGRTRVLFFCEAVTLAHVARPVALAESLDRASFDAHIACDARYSNLFKTLELPRHELYSIPSEEFLARLSRGSPVFSAETLETYIADDLRLIEAVDPDIVVGDFRLSLTVSSKLAGKPYVAISNAYWSPYAEPRFMVPNIPVTGVLGLPLSQWIFDRIRPMVFAYHCRPMAKVRRHHGLDDLGSDIRRYFTIADRTLYADIPELIPTVNRPDHHLYMGHVPWQPEIDLPDWWEELPDDRPLVYVNLGSSGLGELLPTVLESLGELEVRTMVATAGRCHLDGVGDNTFEADYLPGDQAAQRADLMICNGGSPSALQAVAAGTPVIGLPSNFDQFLNMAYFERAGLGTILRPDRFSKSALLEAVTRILGNRRVRARIEQVQDQLKGYQPPKILSEVLATI
ncbi:MAG: glycosyltransferase [Pseudomonadota bacterium]